MQRQTTVKFYAVEIEELYCRSSENEGGIVNLPKIDVCQDEGGLKEKIGGLVPKVLGSTPLEHDQDFVKAVIDSLHIMTLVKQLRASMLGVLQEQIKHSASLFVSIDYCACKCMLQWSRYRAQV